MKQKIHYLNQYFFDNRHHIVIKLIGCGGNGSAMLANLARINLFLTNNGHKGLHVITYDDDTVTNANRERQSFSIADQGIEKAVIATSRINSYYGTSWEYEPVKLSFVNINTVLHGSEIIITCVDKVSPRKIIFNWIEALESYRKTHEEGFSRAPFYWMDLGNDFRFGQMIFGTMGKLSQTRSKKYRTVTMMKNVIEEYPDIKDPIDTEYGCSANHNMQTQDLFINSHLALLSADYLFSLLKHKYTHHRGILTNLDTGLNKKLSL